MKESGKSEGVIDATTKKPKGYFCVPVANLRFFLTENRLVVRATGAQEWPFFVIRGDWRW
jgi:hypothetical protein